MMMKLQEIIGSNPKQVIVLVYIKKIGFSLNHMKQ